MLYSRCSKGCNNLYGEVTGGGNSHLPFYFVTQGKAFESASQPSAKVGSVQSLKVATRRELATNINLRLSSVVSLSTPSLRQLRAPEAPTCRELHILC